MKRLKISILLMSMIGLYANCLQAHGVSGAVSQGGIVITATYDSGDPMSYSKVTILAPDAKLQFQSGRTDRNGRFCFFPDGSGQWEVLITDGMGHRLAKPVVVDETLSVSSNSAFGNGSSHLGKAEKALMGLSILFGMTGLLYGWRTRRLEKLDCKRHR
jgi:nickel transport protein